jgi:hypothetical protein
MEHLFSPCARLFDLLEDEWYDYDETIKELNLDVSTQELLSAQRAFTYADLYAMLENGNTVVWLTPHTAAVRVDRAGSYAWGQLDESCYFSFSVDGKEINAFGRSHEHLLEICDVVLRLLAASVAQSVILVKSRDGASINATSLEYLMEQCQSLICLSLHHLEMNENHCRVLGTYSRPGLKIELWHCRITDSAAETMAEVLGRNQGPTKLAGCEIDNYVLADGLRGNSRLKSLTLRTFNHDATNQELLAISSALKENKGLVVLHLRYDFWKSDETWGAICDSLETHPTLEVLELFNHVAAYPSSVLSLITPRVQALVDMLKANMLIHTIGVHYCYREHELYRKSVIPCLETNRLRPRLLAIQKTRPITYRAKVLGRALLAVRTDPNSFWMLLSGNPEVAFPSTTTTIAAAVRLPTPAAAAAAATSTANVAAAASVMPALTTTATGSLPKAAAPAATSATTLSAAAAANVVIPSAGQKRKARP